MRVASPIRMIFYTDQGAVAIKATISSTEPLTVLLTDANAKLVAEGNRTLLVFLDCNQYFKAEAAVYSISGEEGEWTMQLSDELWEEVDRRRYARHRVDVPVEMKAILEENGMSKLTVFSGLTEDLSVGGAWVHLDRPIEAGSLVEFQATLSPTDHVRVLGIVAHSSSEKSGFGIEFIDYVGSARYVLHSYLSRLAA